MTTYSTTHLIKHFMEHESIHGEIHFDNLRRGLRIEILCAYILILINNNSSKELIYKLVSKLIRSSSTNEYSLEYGYAIENENVGYPGLIPTCFQLYVLIRFCYNPLYINFPERNIIFEYILKKADYLYSLEQNGRFPKAQINKSNVLNTNLFTGYIFALISNKLDRNSVRRTLYEELVQRVTKRVISRQEINGAFPYHEECFKYPINYHSMVSGLLIAISNLVKNNNQKIYVAGLYGLNYFKKYINGKAIVKWDKIPIQDKHGASWTTGWLLHQLPKHLSDAYVENRYIAESKKFMGSDERFPKRNSDIFFTSWFIIAEDISMGSNVLQISNSQKIYWWYLKIFNPFYWVYILFKIFFHRIKNLIFYTGALENKYWN